MGGWVLFSVNKKLISKAVHATLLVTLLLYVQEFLTHFYSKLLYVMGQHFLDRQYVKFFISYISLHPFFFAFCTDKHWLISQFIQQRPAERYLQLIGLQKVGLRIQVYTIIDVLGEAAKKVLFYSARPLRRGIRA